MDAEFSNREIADMLMIYGESLQNARAAQRLYLQRFPRRRQPDRRKFQNLYQNIVDFGIGTRPIARDRPDHLWFPTVSVTR